MTNNKFFVLSSVVFVAAVVFLAAFIFTSNSQFASADHNVATCATYTEQSTCTTDSLCLWDMASNFCYHDLDAPTSLCDTYTTQAMCSSYPECSWDGSGNYCFEGASGACPSGFHPHMDSGGYCMNDAEDYSGTCYNPEGTTIIACPSQQTCSAGFYWDSFDNVCKADCGYYTDQASCILYPDECYWDESFSSCYYGIDPGNQTCSAGFYWDSYSNTCAVDCYYYIDQTSCGSFAECQWDMANNFCYQGPPPGGECEPGFYFDHYIDSCVADCGYYADQASCTLYAECEWDLAYNYCYYGATGCEVNATEATCMTYPECAWDTVSTSCYYSDPASECPQGYFYDYYYNTCAVDCGNYADQTSCNSYTECAWNIDYNYCDYGAPVSECPQGFYYRWELGGFCMNELDDFNGICYDGTGITQITCPNPETAPLMINQFDSWTSPDGYLSAGVMFSKEVDQSTLTESNIYIIKVSDGSTVPGVINKYPPDGVDYSLSAPAETGVDYQLIVRIGVKDFSGEQMAEDYASPIFQAFYIEQPDFYVDWNNTYPRDGDWDIGTNVKIHVEFSKNIDPASNLAMSFEMWSTDKPDVFVAGTFDVFANGFEFAPLALLEPNTTYNYEVFGDGIHDVNGTPLGWGINSWFTTGAGIAVEGGKITGIVTDADGKPLPDAWIDVHTVDWAISRGTGSGPKGNYTVSNIPPGIYLIDVYPPPQMFNLISPAPVSVTVVSGQVITQNLSFVKATKTIKGKVTHSDGRVISDAYVEAYRRNGNGWAQTKTDPSGNYELNVSGGSWEVYVYPASAASNWTYNKEPKGAMFANDSTLESKIIDFIVVSVDSQVTGRVLRPDGTSPPPYTTFIELRGGAGVWFGGEIDEKGFFRIYATAGTYEIGIYSEDPNFSAPSISPITVASGETKDIGTITLVIKSDHIRGKVSDQSGKGIADVRVEAWVPEGFDYAWTITDANGTYDLLVNPGNWEVYARPEDPSANYYNPEPPRRIEVISGVAVVVDFVFLSSDAGISGKVVDSAGNVLSDLYGHVELIQATQVIDEFGFDVGFGPGTGGPIDRGIFKFKAPAGTYTLQVFMPPDTPYTPGPPQTVTLISGKTTEVTVVASENNSSITGILKDKDGTAITGIDVFVFASSQKGTWQEAIVDRSTGRYTLSVAAGTWYLGYWVDPASGYLSEEGKATEVTVGEGETVSKDLILTKAGSKIVGQITDPNGKGMPYVWVEIGRSSFSGVVDLHDPALFAGSFVGGAETDSSGNYSVAVPAGTYYVNVFIPPYLGYIAPEEKAVTAPEGGSVTANLQLRTADLAIEGRVWVGDIPVEGAYIWGWSERGGYQEAVSAIDGSFSLKVSSSDVWHIGAGAPINGEFFKANEVRVEVLSSNVLLDIYLTKFKTLDPTAVKTADATKPTVLESSGGVSVVAPANAFANEGNITINIKPDTRVSSQGETRVVGTAYEISAVDAQGATVAKFNSDVTVTIPYTEEDVAALGTTEDNLELAFWDETVGVWKVVDNFVVNKEDNVITGSVNHFTRFAIISAADVTAPSGPTNVVAESLGDGKIKLTWTNPTADFSHAKIYRSEAAGELGIIRSSEINASEYTDTGLTDGTTYYYTVRSVDPAGNESVNTEQVMITAAGTSVSVPTESILNEGDLIRGPDGIKVYIINGFGYRRHIFNPAVFDMYAHFSWNSIKAVSQSVLDSYKTSDLYRALEDPKVYSLEEMDEAAGNAIKHHIEMTSAQFMDAGYDWNQVFIVNSEERDYYETGTPLT